MTREKTHDTVSENKSPNSIHGMNTILSKAYVVCKRKITDRLYTKIVAIYLFFSFKVGYNQHI